MTTKYVDTAAIMQVIGCVYNCPSLLDQEDKYNIIDEDFVEEFHKIVFGAIYKIYTLGSKKITLSNISDFLSSRPKSEAVYMQQKGEEWLTRVSANSDLSSFDYYYNRLKKFSLLRAYDNCGIDVTEIYDPDNILDIKRKQVQEEALDNSTLAEIAQKIDDRIDSIKLSYIDENNTDSVQAGEGMIDLLEQYQAVPEIGVPLFGPMVNTVTRGARLKKFYLRSAPTGLGKAILTTEIIPTPNGYRKAGDIQVGDFLWGPEGRPVRVLARYPQQYQNKIYIITFEDGRQARCCKSHLWYARQEDSDTFETLTTTELNHRMHHYKKKENPFFYVPQTQPPQYREKEFDYPPYIIGPFMMDKKDFLALYTTNDNLRLQIDSALGYSSSMAGMVKISNKPYINDFDTYRLTEFPTEYLMGSAVQREQVLQGFLDFYSQIDPKTSELVITTDNEDIKKNLSEIVYSLGMKCKICENINSCIACRIKRNYKNITR